PFDDGSPGVRARWSTRVIDELLYALAFITFCNIDIPPGIGVDIVCAVKFAGPVPSPAELADDFKRAAPENPHQLVRAVGNNEERLRRIGRKSDIPGGATAERLFRDEHLVQKRAVLPEDLDAVIGAVADVNEAIAGDPHRMNDAELRRRRSGRII